MNILGYFHGIDPAAAVLSNGEVVAYVEEERLVRYKHAPGFFPIQSIEACLSISGLEVRDIDLAVCGWDSPRYSDGRMEQFFADVNGRYPPDARTRAWQRGLLQWFSRDRMQQTLCDELVRHFGISPEDVPPLEFYPHHKSHGAAAFLLSDSQEALILTCDGSGDRDCTVIWHGTGTTLTPLHRIEIPHSLGWFYAAITEFLGFKAYDGEYKVMGLAAYGRENLDVRASLSQVVYPGPEEWDYNLDPRYIFHGAHTYSDRFTDDLVDLLRLPPRLGPQKLEPAHEDVAFEAQRLLEETVLRLLGHFAEQTGLRTLCISGGVGLNVKLNSRILRSGLFLEVHPFPVPNDSGIAIGAAAGLWVERSGNRPHPLSHLYLGPSYEDADVELQIRSCGLPYRVCDDIAQTTADLLASGKVVGWFQGALEGGPRALGNRSILADPRDEESRDRVNAAIKFREYWRPFCPSLTEESAARFMLDGVRAPFMILASVATNEAKSRVPAVVHVDDTMRAQTVDRRTNPLFHRLLTAFEERTGLPVVLNTSFNVKGEAIVCAPRDALRTFWSTGLDALAIGPFLIEKPVTPLKVTPADAIR